MVLPCYEKDMCKERFHVRPAARTAAEEEKSSGGSDQ